jgi:hypothetical protein
VAGQRQAQLDRLAANKARAAQAKADAQRGQLKLEQEQALARAAEALT